MKSLTTAIIGGGASGLILATSLDTNNGTIAIFERGERVGKKLSSTGNGQGNVTNVGVCGTPYFFHSDENGDSRIKDVIGKHDNKAFVEYLKTLGVLTITDERGRVYPSGRQASAVTDALRFAAANRGVEIRLGCNVTKLQRVPNGFILTVKTAESEEEIFAKNVALCAGGKAAKNFGTDGAAYALATGLGHTLTPLYPSLVQLKTDVTHTKTLKGIRVNDGHLTAQAWDRRAKKLDITTLRGDIIFTDYGVSGDAVFRASAFVTDKLETADVTLTIDFLPEFSEEEIYMALAKKRSAFPELPVGELLCGIVNNQIGRAVLKRANGDLKKAAKLVKEFPLTVVGSLGFDYAQVTKGGVRLDETDENLQSKYAPDLYFAGEILDVDGQCGGFNLQWAYSSAQVVAAAINGKYADK